MQIFPYFTFNNSDGRQRLEVGGEVSRERREEMAGLIAQLTAAQDQIFYISTHIISWP